MKTYHYLYRVTHIESGRIYIGIHSTNDLEDRYFANGVYEASDATEGDWIRLNHGDKPHEGHIKLALVKYGRRAFKREIIEWFETREDLITREAEIVTKDFVDRDDNFNHRTGGVANIEFSEEARQKISDNNPMKRADVREKVAQARKEYWTQERREEFSKNNWMKKEENKHLISGKNHSWYGRQHTEESKEKISRANAGRVRSKDAIEAQREKIKDYWSDPARVAQRKSMKGIPKPGHGKKVADFYKKNTEILDTKTGKIHNSLDEIVDVLAAEGIHRKKASVSEYVRGEKGKRLGLDTRFRYLKNPKQR